MKKISKYFALVLVMTMVLSMTAMAAVDPLYENDKATITGANGAAVTFDQTVDPETGKKIDEKINVTYTEEGLSGE